MPFDPDAYLASKAASFDPDAYLAQKKKKVDSPTYTDSPVNSSIPVPTPVSKSEWDDNSPLPRHIMPFNKDMSLAKPYDENNPMGAYLNPEGMLSALKVGAYNVAAMPAMLGGAWASLGKSPKEQEEIMKDWMKHATRIRESSFGDKEEQGQQAIDTLMNEVGIPMMGIGHGSFRPEAYSKKPVGTPKPVVPGSPEATRAALAEQNKPAAPLPPSDPTQFSGVGSEYAQLQQIKQRLLGSKKPEDKATLAAIEQRLTELNTAAYTQRLRGNQLGFQGDLASVGDAFNSFDRQVRRTSQEAPNLPPVLQVNRNGEAHAPLDAGAMLSKERQPQLNPGEMQGDLFGYPMEGQATPYNAGQAGVSEPINPMRSRRQMPLQLEGERLVTDSLGETWNPNDRGGIAGRDNAVDILDKHWDSQYTTDQLQSILEELRQVELEQQRKSPENIAAQQAKAQQAQELQAKMQAVQEAINRRQQSLEQGVANRVTSPVDLAAREREAQVQANARQLPGLENTNSELAQRYLDQQRLRQQGPEQLAQMQREEAARQAAEQQRLVEEQQRQQQGLLGDEQARLRQVQLEEDVKRQFELHRGAEALAKTGLPPTPEAFKAASTHPDVMAAAKKVTNAEASLQRAVESTNAKNIKAARTKLNKAKADLEVTRNRVAQSPKGESLGGGGGIIEMNAGVSPSKAVRDWLNSVHPELAAMGVTPKMVDLYKRIHAMEQANRDLVNDPYLVPKGQKIAYSRLQNSFINSMLDKNMNYGLVMQAFDRISGKDRLRVNLDYLHDGPHVAENPFGKDVIDLNSGLRFPKRQRGAISEDLLGVGKLHGLLRNIMDRFKKPEESSSTVNRDQAMASINLFEGTFNKNSIIDAVNSAISGKDGTNLVLMKPSEFHKVASKRNTEQLNTDPYSIKKRERVRRGLASENGLDDIPYLLVDKDGQVYGHEGRHRMDVFQNKGVDKVPVRIIVEGNGKLPSFIKDQNKKGMHHFWENNDILISDKNRHLFNGEQLPRVKAPLNINKLPFNSEVHPYDLPGTTEMNAGIRIPRRQRGAIDPDLLTLGLTKLFHAGREFKEWDPNTIGTGEGMAVLGPGLYAGDKQHLAKIFEKYGNIRDMDNSVIRKGVTNEMAVDISRIIDQRKNLSPEMSAAYDKAVAVLDKLGLRASTRGLRAALADVPAGIRQRARMAVVKAGIDGLKENLGENLGYEYAIFNPDAIKQISRVDTPVEKYVPKTESSKKATDTRGQTELDAVNSKIDTLQERWFSDSSLSDEAFAKAYAPLQAERLEILHNLDKQWVDMNAGIPIPKGVKDFFSEVSDNVDRNLKGLKFYNPEKEKGKLMDNITGLDTSSVLAKPDAPENVIQAAIHSSDTPSILASVQSGAGLTASKFNNNPLIQHVGRTIKYAYQMAEKGQRELVAPVKKAFNSLARDDFRLLMGVLRDESINFDSNGNVVPYSRASLEQTLSRRQLAAYDMLRAAQDKILDIENKGRAILGKDPITAREAYMASRWEGDWHAPVLDKDGKLVWYIRENSKGDAKRAIEYLKQNFGDNLALDGVEPQYRATNFAAGTPRDVIGAYHDMMEFMKDNNPGLVEHMENAMAEYQSQKGYTIAGQNKHFLNKAGVRGYLGDQPWKSESVNANNLGRSQIDYMNNALHWAHMQEAIANLKEVLSNEEVASKQKNAVQYSSLLMANELGSIQPQWLKGFEGAVAQALGTSKGSLYKGVGSVKTLGYLQLLGLSPGYMIATPLQALMTVPSWHMRLSGEGFKHNVAKTSLLALGDFSAAMAEHAAHNLGKESVRLPMSDLGRAADQYAQQSGMVSKNLFGESGIGQHEATQRIGDLAGWTIGLPEKVARYSTFLSFAHHLEASGKYASRAELFRHAEELTDNALTSFRSADRPLIVNQAGATGQAMYMLKSFVFNSYNQLSSHARQANKAPLLAMLAMTGIMGGAMALPLMDEMDKMFSLIKKAVAHVAPDKGSDIHQAPSLRELSFSLSDKMGPLKTIIQSGAVSAATGAQMKSRFSMGTGITDLAAPAQEMKENGAILKAAINPTKDQMLAGVHANMPPLIQGQMEANLDAFKDKNNPQIAYRPTTLGDNPQAINHKRTPEDWNYRKLGLKSLAEANDVETANLNREHELNRQTALTKLSGYLTSSIKNGDKEAIASNIKAIYKLEPDVDISALIGQKAEQLHLTPEQRDIIHMQSVNAIRDYQRLQGMRK